MAGHRLGQAVARPAGGEIWILERPGARRPGQGLRPEHITALIWAGGSLMPVGADSAAAESLAPVVRRRGGHYVSIVGDQAAVAALWAGLSSAWPAPRAYRPNQPLMALSGLGRIEPDPAVGPATPDMLEAMVPACRAMFTEELGFAPPGPEMGYRAHVANQIERGNLLANVDPASGRVVFKAELGAACGPWVQIQGVWTDPAYRGRGIAKRGMAAVVAHARRRGWSQVCLYVNDFNAAALAVYRALGFIQVGTWATVML
jgi:GNAT superfamily N-acetyltransferase